jgi:hypothetical protein
MSGIGAEIHQYLMHLGGVAHDKGIRLDVHADIDGGGQRGPQQRAGFLDNPVQLDRLHFVFALPAEGQNLLDEVFGPQAGLEHLLHVVGEGGIRRGIFHGHFGESDHGGKDVVEIVGNAAGQRADGLHLLGLAQLPPKVFFFLFGLDAFGQVIHRYEYAFPAVLISGRNGRFDQQVAIVALEGPVDAFNFEAAGLGHGHKLCFKNPLGGLRQNAVDAAQQLFLANGFVEREGRSVHIDDPDHANASRDFFGVVREIAVEIFNAVFFEVVEMGL